MEKQKPVKVYNREGIFLSHCTVKRATKMVSRKKAEWRGHNQVTLLVTQEDMKRIRRQVISRDGCVCTYCGDQLEVSQVTVDHLIPETRGGEDSVENLVVACAPCNKDKANFTYEEYFLLLAQRIALLKKGYPATGR